MDQNKAVFPKANRIAIKLSKAGQREVKKGHPWVFKGAIEKQSKPGKNGDLAIVFDRHTDKVIAVGLLDLASNIRIKILSNTGPVSLDSTFFKHRIKDSWSMRKPLFKTNTNAYRLIYGESDGFPGLIADVYNTVLVVKVYSAMWFPYLEGLTKLMAGQAQTATTVLRLSRNVAKLNAIYSDGMVLDGELEKEEVPFLEHDLHFTANVIKGHKTGYFLDHRANRKRVGSMAKNKTVLDVFSYAGGFTVHALAGGATKVTSVDISAQALAVAKANVSLNKHSGIHNCLQGDAFKILANLASEGKKFNIVVVDPPSFAKQQTEVPNAIHAYKRLIKLAIPLVANMGVLVAASCSSRVSAGDFFNLVTASLRLEGQNFEVLETTYHDIDHPVSIAESAYLKCGYYKFE